MIIDKLCNAESYTGCHPLLSAAFDFLCKNDLAALPAGRIDLQPGLYVLIQEKITKGADEVRWEAHEQYIDIQMLISGTEKYGYAPKTGLICTQPYLAEKDVAFYEGSGNAAVLQEGEFMMFFPQDAHQPQLTPFDQPLSIKKAVVKVKL